MKLSLRKFLKKYETHRIDVAVSFLEKGNNLLDVGCADSLLIFKAREKFNKLYGIDIDANNIKKAQDFALKNSCSDQCEFSVVDANKKMDFEDNFFDCVTIIGVISNLNNPFAVMKEVKRIIKKDGVLIIHVGNLAYIKHRIRLLLGQLPMTSAPYNFENWENLGWDRGVLHYFTHSTIKWLLELNGFKIEKMSNSGLFAKLRSWWPSLLCGDIILKARNIK
ncbi:MAG: class I SAM-dependent methyltransferase [Candidatus Pacebacteria bacterium]|nr:class I SAM-dependent methyltransferase [Candidatus Paceibacterota bacterium]